MDSMYKHNQESLAHLQETDQRSKRGWTQSSSSSHE